MTFLITNDDGIDAPGIRTLYSAISKVTQNKVILVAPKDNLTGCSHQINTRTKIHVERRASFEFAVASTPVDCVRLGITHLCDDVTFVLSGINAGCNLGIADFYPSGTIAAVREASLHGIPGIAFSQFRKFGLELNWNQTEQWTIKVLNILLNHTLEKGSFWNVNFPYLCSKSPEPEIVFCELCNHPLSTEFKLDGEYFQYIGRDINRISAPSTDVSACLSGKIAITKIGFYQINYR